MKGNQLVRNLVMVATAMTLTITAAAQAGQFKVLHEFKGNFDGSTPVAGLIEDSSGNLYGTTLGGGFKNSNVCTFGCGTVFELSPNGSGLWTKTVLYYFTGRTDGGQPSASLVMDGAGNLYGTTENGGSLLCGIPGCGTVFELSPNGSGGWTESTIYSFTTGSGGFSPIGLLLNGGNLYGVAFLGGADWGVVYELSPGTGGVWTETVLHTFENTDGAGPDSALYMDSSGNLFGTAMSGGVLTGSCKGEDGCGTVFELSPKSGGGWNFSEYSFPVVAKGVMPFGAVREDAEGNLFGVATVGGGTNFEGVMYKLTPITGVFGGWTESVLHRFDVTDGTDPVALIEDGNGGYYAAVEGGGKTGCNGGCGLVVDMKQTSGGGWEEIVLHHFTGGFDGSQPNPLYVDANGNIFGTAGDGGSTACPGGCGTVFEITAPTAR
jgi:uncharacterized repeat protein (TIGR03803 family)